MPFRNFEFRIYPSRKQRKRLKKQFYLAKKMYNILIIIQRDNYHATGECLSRIDMYEMIVRLKELDPEFKTLHSQVLQNLADRISKAYTAFFRRVKEKKAGKNVSVGFPRYKKWIKSIIYPQSGFKFKSDKRLYISKVGNVPIVLHRVPKGKLKTMAVKWTRTDKWFVVFSTELETKMDVEIDPKIKTDLKIEKAVGIDVGIKSFATFSDGVVIENPRHLIGSEKRLKRLQRRVSRKKKGSNNRRKARLRLSVQHERVRNQRKDFHHKVSRDTIDYYNFIAVEKLNVQGMIRNHCLAKHIADVGWGQFLQMVEYKAESANARFVAVNPRNTSQECSGCGATVEKDLSTRIHDCPECGLKIDRDLNAAINILNVARRTVGLTGTHACGDPTSTSRHDRDASRVVEAGTKCRT